MTLKLLYTLKKDIRDEIQDDKVSRKWTNNSRTIFFYGSLQIVENQFIINLHEKCVRFKRIIINNVLFIDLWPQIRTNKNYYLIEIIHLFSRFIRELKKIVKKIDLQEHPRTSEKNTCRTIN